MSAYFPFRKDEKLIDVLNRNSFTLSAEIIPPRNGAEQAKVLASADDLIKSGAQFLAVTKGAGGSLRGGSLPIAQVIKENFQRPCIAHFTCRDLVPAEVENLLMDHHYFGIRNILALRGDPPDGQKEWTPREGGYSYAYELIQQIKNLNRGVYLKRPSGPSVSEQEATDFCIGAAVYPEHPNSVERLEFFRKKVEAGADYGITDMLFDAEVYARFLEDCGKAGLSIPILPGSRLLRTRSQAERMMTKFKVSIPSDIFNQLPETDSPDATKFAVERFLVFGEKLRSYGAPGIHIFVISDTFGACESLKQLAHQKKELRI